MREFRQRADQILRLLCLILAGLLVYELAGVAIRWNPFRGVAVPELPTLSSAATNEPAGNVAVTASPPKAISNTPPALLAKAGTNSDSETPTNNVGSVTNALIAKTGTNTSNDASNTVAKIGTNSITLTNLPVANLGTNARGESNHLAASDSAGTNRTESSKSKVKKKGGGPAPEMAMFNRPGFGMPGMPHPSLSPGALARVHQITESEILGPVMRPLPMALLGIAGQFAFLRTDNGQTGLVKEGDTLGDLKLLRIGINRVLVEQNGQKKELMIFAGYGGESLLPKDSSNENSHS